MARPYIYDLCYRWLPDGQKRGNEWVARNPHRKDAHLGSFSINLNTGRWQDFATGDRGSDIIALAAFLHFPHSERSQHDAAVAIAQMLRLSL